MAMEHHHLPPFLPWISNERPKSVRPSIIHLSLRHNGTYFPSADFSTHARIAFSDIPFSSRPSCHRIFG